MEQFFEPLIGGVSLFGQPSILLMLFAGMLWGSIGAGRGCHLPRLYRGRGELR
jgi:hypothetical protein